MDALNINNQVGGTSKDFAISTNSVDKSSPEIGLQICRRIAGSIAGTNSYYWLRNARYRLNRDLASGKIDIFARFADRLEMNGKFNYINLNWSAIKIVNTIISRLVGRWMDKREKIQVSAIDNYSEQQKKDNYDQAEFVLDNKELLAQLQDASGVPMISQDQFVAEDKDDLDLWAAEHNRLPEEIKYEKGCNNIFTINGLFDVIKEVICHDSAEVGFVGTYTEMGEDGIVKVRDVRPENAIYYWSRYPDFRDNMMRGEKISLTISQIRDKYPDMKEEELFELAQFSKDYQLTDKLTWQTIWVNAWSRPYDDWNIDVIQFEYKTLDEEVWSKKNSFAGTRIVKKNQFPIPTDAQVKKRKVWNIYKGVYATEADKLLEWGLKKNMIKPQDPKESGDVEFSYSFYMYQNYEMRNVAIPEKIEEPVDEMILARLKMQQLVMKMRPIGAAINEDALQAIDYGLGEDGNKTVDPKKHYDQTGDIYYRGRDAEGNPIPVPITELQNSGFLPQMQGLIALYQYHYQVLKDELGEDPNLINAASTPRVAVENIQASQQEAEHATDYMYEAYVRVMEDTARKVACLLHDSVRKGASAYRHLMNEKDVANRIFSTDIKLLPTDFELAQLQGMVNNMLTSNPDFIAFVDPFKVMRIAKENIKEGELYFRQAQKRYIKNKQQQAMENVQSAAQAQIQSAQAKAQTDMQLKTLEGKIELDKATVTSEGNNKSAIINMVSSILSKGVAIDPLILPLVQTTVTNIMLPMVAENEEQKQELIRQTQEAIMQQQQQTQGEPMPDDEQQQAGMEMQSQEQQQMQSQLA